MKTTRFVGLDVHADTIAVAVAEGGREGEVRSLGVIPNTDEAVRRLVKKLGPAESLRACYEAGPTGYVLYWELTRLGVPCVVIAPTLVPVKAGDRVKTDRRDAVKLARCHRAGELTPVYVPDKTHEALRHLVRRREAAKENQQQLRQQLSKFLLNLGRRPPEKIKAWGKRHLEWLRTVDFDEPALNAVMADHLAEVEHARERLAELEHWIDAAVELAPETMRKQIEALQALRGVAKLTATTVVVEVGTLSRFERPTQLMSYSGLVPSEHSSGEAVRRGSITKTGNAHLRRVLGEAAWSYQRRPAVSQRMRALQGEVPETVRDIAWKAQQRLHRRFLRLKAKGKAPQKVVIAVARELLGFMWAIGVATERAQDEALRAVA